ncbi:MAG TPA: hypothetical protein VJ617_19910 [Arthrobacter sp.]|nr:hypothetical protein [Arthrobacter sp.]
MAITSSGYDGSVTELAWSKMVSGVGSSEYGVLGSNDFRVTAVAGADRTVSIATGSAWGKGIFDTNDANITVQLDTVATGTRWDLIAIRRNWTGASGTSTVLKINGGTAKTIPARNTSPGVLDDQPLALVQITAGQTQPTAIVDLRAWGGNGGMTAMDLLSLGYLERLGAQVVINGEEWACGRNSGGTVAWTKTSAPTSIGLYGASGSAINGTTPPDAATAGPAFLMQAGSQVATTDNAGYGRLTWPRQFPNGVLSVILTNGDSYALGSAGWFNVEGNAPFWGTSGSGGKSDVIYVAVGWSGGAIQALPNRLHRVNYIVIGY